MQKLPPLLSTGAFTFGAVTALESLANLATNQRCPEIKSDTILQYTQLLLDNPAYKNKMPQTALHLMRSRQYTHPDGSAQIIEELSQAWLLDPQMEIGLDLVVALRNANRDCSAQTFLEQAIDNPPKEWASSKRSKSIAVYKKFLLSFSGMDCGKKMPTAADLETNSPNHTK
jgi:hypothetical protein